jgi:hypothetical protein
MEATKAQLAAALALAESWVNEGVDINEVGKLIAHLRAGKDWNKTLELARRLSTGGPVRSKQTIRYYQTIHRECSAQIRKNASAEAAGRILGWAFRLARFKKLEALDRQVRNRFLGHGGNRQPRLGGRRNR